MKPFLSIFGSIVIVIVIVFLLFALVIVLINLADKYREKEGEHERIGIIPIQLENKSDISLMLTNDRTFFGRIPEGCEAFALAENESCYINTSKGKRELPLNSDLVIIRTGVDGVPFLEKVEYLRFSLLTRGDRVVRTKYRLHVPNIAMTQPEECRWKVYSAMVRGDEQETPLYSTRRRRTNVGKVCFRVKEIESDNRAYVVQYDPNTGIDFSIQPILVTSRRIYETCHPEDRVSLGLDDYILHC